MSAWLLKRLLSLILTLLGSTLLIFALIRLVPGDPVLNMLGERGAQPEVVAMMRAKMGMDQPWLVQYAHFLGNALRGDLGQSIVTQEDISTEFWARMPATLELSFIALLWALPLAILMGCWAAVRRGSVFDSVSMGISTVGYSMPLFWWALILIVVFSVGLGWFPVSGRIAMAFDVPRKTGFLLIDAWFAENSAAAFLSALKHLALPAFALGSIPLAMLTRIVRNSMTEVLQEDYIRTAHAKGADEKTVIFHHALRNSLIPVITGFGLLLSMLVTGAVLTETIFSWPGVGRWILKGLESRDYPQLQGGLLYLSFFVLTISFLVDWSYFYLNPKLRSQI